MSQDGLRGLAGMARTHLIMIENDTIYANIETVWKIADTLDLRPSELSAWVKETIPNDGMGAVTAPILFYNRHSLVHKRREDQGAGLECALQFPPQAPQSPPQMCLPCFRL